MARGFRPMSDSRGQSWHDLGIDVPSGRHGDIKTVCPECRRTGTRANLRDKSLSVNTDTGLFKCHYCNFKGKLGGRDNERTWGRISPVKVYAKPDRVALVELCEPTLPTKVADFFTTRKISPEAIDRRQIAVGSDGGIKFPYYRDGELVNIKTRYPGKKFSMEAGCELIFYGLDDCAGAEQVVIVEGEMDALAFETAGITRVLSVPNGSQTGEMAFLQSAEAIFTSCHTVVLAVDNDLPGLALESELARRIGKEKCYRTRWPEGCKDANDVLMQHGTQALWAALADAEAFPMEGVREAKDVVQDMVTAYRIGIQRGLSTGWTNLDNLYTIKPGQLTIVTGVPGSGKSEWVDSLALNLARDQDWPIAVYSPENYPLAKHYEKFCEKHLGKPFNDGPTPRMSEAEMLGFMQGWAQKHLFAISPEEPTLAEVLEKARVLKFRHGIRGLIIDPWNELDHSGRPASLSETEWVSRSLTMIRTFARDNEVHVWLVAHPRIMRKENGKTPVPTPYDISGSAHFFNKADNSITVQRNKDDDNADVEIHVQKIRFREIGRLGRAMLSYDVVTGRYRDTGRWDTTPGPNR